MYRIARISLPALVAAIALLLVIPVHGVDKGNQNTLGRLSVSPGKPEMKKDYTPVLGFSPSGAQQAVNPRACGAANYCDTIRVDIDPEGSEASNSTRAILTWNNPKEYDLDLAVFTPSFSATGAETTAANGYSPPIRDCKTLGKNHPESCPVTADIPTDRPLSQNYWYIVVNNLTDPNDAGVDLLGYRITVQFSFENFEEFAIDEDLFFGGGGSQFEAETNFDETGGLSLDSDEIPDVEASPITLPGSDGPLSDFDFDVLGESARKAKAKGPLIPLVIAFVVLGAGSFGFFYLRSRRREETSEQA